MESVVVDVQRELLEKADPARRESGKNFFKEDVRLHGVSSAEVTKIAKKFLARLKHASKQDVFSLCEKLWQSGFLEEGGIACIWSQSRKKDFEPEDFTVFERWLGTYVHNWASCDTLCNHTLGDFLRMFPDHVKRLRQWAGLPNRWMKRGAAVSLIIPARNGLFLEDVFSIADDLLLDPDDMVQKGYGWMLKAASQAHPDEVFAYVMGKKDSMPRTAYRYALEKMPKECRAEAMKK